MNWINNLERKFRGKGITGLTKWIILCYAIGYMLNMISPEGVELLYLEPALILKGQIWRLVSWVLVPPGSFNLFTLITLFFYYSIGVSMERTWGDFRYNLYVFSGLIFTVIGAFLLFVITGSQYYLGGIFSTYYISMSLFLAYAATYPEMMVLLYGIFPLKVKWLGIIYGAMIAYDIVKYVRYGVWFMAVPVIASLLNFGIYFLSIRDLGRRRQTERKQAYHKAMQAAGRANPQSSVITKHKCAICGQTEKDDPDLEFRFCTKCNGNYEYCQNHLFTHQHVK